MDAKSPLFWLIAFSMYLLVVSVFGVKFSLDPLSEQGGAQGTMSAELLLVSGVEGLVADEVDEIEISVACSSIKARISSWPGNPS